jgi:hypothetical protein
MLVTREIPRPPASNLSRIIEDGQSGGTSHETMMGLLKSYPYKSVKPSSAYASPGADLERQMEGWETMPYPQPDTSQELRFAVQRDLLSKDDLSAVQDAIEARTKRPRAIDPRPSYLVATGQCFGQPWVVSSPMIPMGGNPQ